MTRGDGHASPGRVMLRRAFLALVGEVYLDRTSGEAVRVIDSRSPATPRCKYVVESANGHRPGERWLCGAEDLRGPLGATSPLGAACHEEGRLAPARATVACAVRLLEETGVVLGALAAAGEAQVAGGLADDVKRLSVALRATADALGDSSEGLAGEEATP